MKFSKITSALLPLLLLSPASAQTCSTLTKKQCNSPCQWRKGACVEGQTPNTPAPTPAPGPPTTIPPSPTPPSSCSSINRSKQCNNTPGCTWGGKRVGCTVLITQAPTSAPSTGPTVPPTKAPTSPPTVAPTQAPTPANGGLVSSPSCISGYTCLQNSDFGVVDETKWDLDLHIESLNPDATKNAYVAARAKWSSLIVSNNFNNQGGTSTSGLTNLCTNDYPPLLDDTYICGRDKEIDGPGKVLGQAGPRYQAGVGSGGGFIVIGFMEFDIADIASLVTEGTWEAVILHEMAHVLGIGTYWEAQSVVGASSAGYPYLGTTGTNVWQGDWGCTGSPPVETDQGGAGTVGGHWDEACLDNELMTGFLNSGVENPISKLTAATFQDLGYDVDYTSSTIDSSYNGSNTSCCNGRRNLRQLNNGKPPLSAQGKANAIAYGKSALNSRKLLIIGIESNIIGI